MQGSSEQRQYMHPLPRMIPEQIIAGEVLQMPRLELEQRILAEFEQNPALTLDELGLCPVCDAPVDRFPCPQCGHQPAVEDDIPVVSAEDWETYRERLQDADGLEPFAVVAGRETLRDYLRTQWISEASGKEAEVGRFLIDCLNEDGYLTEPLIEIAERFRMSVPQIEDVLVRVQELDPPGVAARTLRECLLIQCSRFEGGGRVRDLARRILLEAWEHLADRRLGLIAAQRGVQPETVEEAAAWIRGNLAPCPGRAYRASWNGLAPVDEPEVAPDVVIRVGENGFIVEIVESSRLRLGVDPEYGRIHKALGRRKGDWKPEWDHVRRSVGDARLLMDAILQRRRTLHKVMTAIAGAQTDFLLDGPARLKPLMQKTIAQSVGVHESTVCRALADKLIRIPSGETIPSTRFFDGSAPVKEVLQSIVAREDPAKPLSDARLAALLTEAGHPIARRTVAKYRDSLRIPAVEHRNVAHR
jgi:RNA polymerase sigma-54 factor